VAQEHIEQPYLFICCYLAARASSRELGWASGCSQKHPSFGAKHRNATQSNPPLSAASATSASFNQRSL
jgi:hypothetical protein